MDERRAGLSEQAATILGLIAEGRSYDQILQRHPSLTYFDIFAAAREALDLIRASELGAAASETGPTQFEVPEASEVPATSSVFEVPEAPEDEAVVAAEPRLSFVERARATHRRAWARWTRDEDARLTALFHQGTSRAAMARELERQPGAIRSRLLKLGLISEDDDERAEPDEPEASPGPERAPSVPMVPGWEAFRDRLTPSPDTP